MNMREKVRRQFKKERSELWLVTTNGFNVCAGLFALASAPEHWMQALGAATVATAAVLQRGVFSERKQFEKQVLKRLDKSGEADHE